MKKTKLITCLLTAALIAASFSGCGASATTPADDGASLKQEQKQDQGQRGSMAKVVSLDGDALTVILANMPSGAGGGGTPPEGERPADGEAQTPPDDEARPNGATPPDGEARPDGATPPDGEARPDGATPPDGEAQPGGGTPPAGENSGQPGRGGGEIEFTGEEVTYTLSDNVSVTKGMGDNATEIDLSEITADSVINFVTGTDEDGNEVIISIQVME